jgi:hypothetical protein
MLLVLLVAVKVKYTAPINEELCRLMKFEPARLALAKGVIYPPIVVAKNATVLVSKNLLTRST